MQSRRTRRRAHRRIARHIRGLVSRQWRPWDRWFSQCYELRFNPSIAACFQFAMDTLTTFARRGYVISQDCRGTGDSEPVYWDSSVYEREDGFDFVDWVTRQRWFDGFLAGCGGSYVGQRQRCMAMHARMSTIVPLVSGLGIAHRTVRKYVFYNAYARTIGKGADKLPVAYDRLEGEMVSETLPCGSISLRPLQRHTDGGRQHRLVRTAARKRRCEQSSRTLRCARLTRQHPWRMILTSWVRCG
ncbi:MAG: CocE/NonD family hydrolase [Gammaproteobacteria bacterium]